MSTYGYGDKRMPVEISRELDRIAEAMADYLCNDEQSCGAYLYYDKDQKKPWRIVDDFASESFATADEAVDAAEAWAPERSR